VLYNLDIQPRGPLPIRATFAPLWNDLAAAYRRFVSAAPPGARTGLTSFLESVDAYRLYRRAARGFEKLQTRYAENETILRKAQSFRERWRSDADSGLVPN
jgi:hypothetical protein